MKVILFGTTGMIGQGVLRECLLDPAVTEVLSIGRAPLATGTTLPGVPRDKLREIVREDLFESLADRRRASPGTTPASSASASRRPA